jgi:hypothetical protein
MTLAPAVRLGQQDEENEEHAEGRGRHVEEVDRRQRAEVVVEEGAPRLGGRLGRLCGHEAGDASLADEIAAIEAVCAGAPTRPRELERFFRVAASHLRLSNHPSCVNQRPVGRL